MSGYLEVNCLKMGGHIAYFSLDGMTPSQAFKKEQEVFKKYPKEKYMTIVSKLKNETI